MKVSPPIDSAEPKGSVLLPWLLAAPLVLLAWPGPSLFAGDFATTEITAAGAGALLLTPLFLWLIAKRPLPFRGYLALFVAWLIPVNFSSPTDTLEVSRATLMFLIAVMAATGAASLSEAGKWSLLKALCSTSILLSLPALFDEASGWGGPLGNSGELSGAALPGAMAGLVLWACVDGKWCWVGMTAVGLFLLHALLAPVLASLVVLAILSLAASAAIRGALPAARTKLASVFVMTLLGAGWLSFSGRTSAPAPVVVDEETEIAAGEGEPASTNLGGFEVRWRIWRASAAMFVDAPLLGVGTGQFAARFPEYRDARERELSNWNREIEQNTEVEHPHNDWLLPWIEGGVIAGVPWIIFLLLVVAAALRAYRDGDVLRSALATGALAAVLGAGMNGPLLYNPTASLASFLIFGALLGPANRSQVSSKRRWSAAQLLTPGLALLSLLHLPRAWDLWQHGQAVADFGASASLTDQAIATEHALAACPDSPIALTWQGRLRDKQDGDLEGALESWSRVLELRPQRFEAWMQSGVLLARLERLDEARAAFARAMELDPAHPGLARNRVRCFAESGLTAQALEEVERLVELGHYDALWLLDLSCELILSGSQTNALPLLARVDERFANLNGESAWALDGEYRRNGNAKVADAFRAMAYTTWAREQAAAEQWDDSHRSYFQALRVMRDYVRPAGPWRTRLEHAASLWHAGQRAEAREAIEALELDDINWAPLPEWTREVLWELGVTQSE